MLEHEIIKQEKKKLKRRKGMTLVELVAVAAIIAVLGMVAVPKFAQITEGSKVAVFEANVDALKSAMTMYSASKGGKLVGNDIEDLKPYFSDVSKTLLEHLQKGLGDLKPTYTLSAGKLTATLSDLKGDYIGRQGEFKDGTYTITFSQD